MTCLKRWQAECNVRKQVATCSRSTAWEHIPTKTKPSAETLLTSTYLGKQKQTFDRHMHQAAFLTLDPSTICTYTWHSKHGTEYKSPSLHRQLLNQYSKANCDIHLYFANHLICRGALTKLPITISSCVWYMIYATNNRWNQHQMRVHSPKALQQQHGWLRYTNHPSQQMQAIRQRNLFKWTCWAHMGSSKLKRYGVPQLSALLILCYWQGHLMWQAVQNPAEQQRPPSCLLLWCIQTNNFPMLNAEQSIYAG